MSSDTTRDKQRERTRSRIAAEACRLFGQRGFDRTSVRHIAAAAGVDAALVLHYFGSKQELFKAVTANEPAPGSLGSASPLDSAVKSLGDKLDQSDSAFLARLRSMLTHPDAAESAREEIANRTESLASALSREDAELHAALALAMNLGITLARELLGVDALVNASTEAILAAVRPALEALLESGT
jgi:AcrR family transcriptional regulator